AWQLGIGGQSLEELTSPDFAYHDTDGWYVNLMDIVAQAVQAAANVGCRYEVATLVWCQGAGGPADYTLYKTRFGEFVDKVQEDIVAETGQKMKPTIIVIQPPGYVSDNLKALVDICAERGDVVLGAVGWGYPRIDNIHFNDEGCIQLGEVLGIVRSHIDAGRPWSAPYLRDVTRSGTTITANVGGPFPIVVDEGIDAIMHYIPDGLGGTEPVPNYGFEYTGANITDVLVEPHRVTITLDADASGTLNFSRSSTDYGDTNGNGNRGTIRADAIWPPLFASDDLRLWMASDYWDL
ncbi:hypothetical protein, partial [uncultured Mameliella sp.]|uniref:hypothetical protein n=1 Tax=uncultured Mameliella sp. TaxID=1447087 RepID=UPI00263A0027